VPGKLPARLMARPQPITPELMVRAYRHGYFPMANGRDDPRLFWLEPESRGVLPLDGLVVSRKLRRAATDGRFQVTCDRDVRGVIAACAQPAPGRENTWINSAIESLFGQLADRGLCHSVECRQDGALVGGLYGVRVGGAFFGESMFSRVPDASKVALVHLVARLRLGGFSLLDTQFTTDHLERMGAVEIPRLAYRRLLARAVERRAEWLPEPPHAALEAEIEAMRAATSAHKRRSGLPEQAV
jgi:leucyl/phenylalanyl-tRNA--protein transferase